MPIRRAIVALLLLCIAALAEDRKVDIDLTDGSHLSGTLVDFGSRVYRFKVGDKVVEIPEDRVSEIRFPRESPATRSVPEIEADLQDLAARQRSLERELAAAREKYTDAHPAVRELQSALEGVEKLRDEATKALQLAKVALANTGDGRSAIEDARNALAVAIGPQDEEKLEILREAAKQTRALHENGQCSELDLVRAEFLAAQWENHVGRLSDAEFAKKCDEARVRVKTLGEAAVKSGTISPSDFAKMRLELIDFYKPLPRVELPARLSADPVGKLVTDAFYHRAENRFELKPRWSADVKGLSGCVAENASVIATTEDGKAVILDREGKTFCAGEFSPGLLQISDLDGDGWVSFVVLPNFMAGSVEVYRTRDLWSSLLKRKPGERLAPSWTARSLHGGLNVPLVADLGGDGHRQIVAAAFGGKGVEVHAGTSGELLWNAETDVSGLCAVRRRGEKGRALVGYSIGHGVNVLSYGGRKEEEWDVHGARCIASGDLDGDGDDEVIVGESAPGDFFGQENRVVARTNEGKEIWAYNLPSGFGLREPNALWVGDLDGDGKAEVLVALSPGIMTREHEKTYDCFLCLLDSQGRPAWISEPFKDAGKMSIGSFCAGISLVDLDGDGKKEVVIGILEQGVRAFDVIHETH